MSLCVVCATRLAGEDSLCPHHHNGLDDGWALTNRIMCNLLHRGIVVARLPRADRDSLRDIPEDGIAAPVEAIAG
jgi:hypothetical protein